MIDILEKTIATSLKTQVRVIEEGLGRYPIFTPFTWPDGDHFNVVLIGAESGSVWKLTDEGSTLMHLSYWISCDMLVIDSILLRHGMENDNGVLCLEFPSHKLGDALTTYLQALTQISDGVRSQDVQRDAVQPSHQRDSHRW